MPSISTPQIQTFLISSLSFSPRLSLLYQSDSTAVPWVFLEHVRHPLASRPLGLWPGMLFLQTVTWLIPLPSKNLDSWQSFSPQRGCPLLPFENNYNSHLTPGTLSPLPCSFFIIAFITFCDTMYFTHVFNYYLAPQL